MENKMKCGEESEMNLVNHLITTTWKEAAWPRGEGVVTVQVLPWPLSRQELFLGRLVHLLDHASK